MYAVLCTLNCVRCIVHAELCTLYCVRCTVYAVKPGASGWNAADQRLTIGFFFLII